VVMALEMAFVLGSTWADTAPVFVQAGDYNNARALGIAMYTQYTFAVEVGALLLLVGMVSAIALTLRRRRDAKPSDPGAAVRVKAKDRFRMVSIPSQRDVATAPASDAPAEGDKQ